MSAFDPSRLRVAVMPNLRQPGGLPAYSPGSRPPAIIAGLSAAEILAQAARPSTQRLWIPGRLPGLNEVIAAAKGSGGRGNAYATMKRQHGELVWALAKAAKLRPMTRVRVAFRWVEKDRRRDPDNVSSAGRKFILDGLVQAGVLPGDGWAAIAGWSDTFEVGAAHGVEITLTED